MSDPNSERAHLIFPVERIYDFFSDGKYGIRVSMSASVAMGAALEYLVAEILESAAEEANDAKRVSVMPQHLLALLKKDSDLEQFFKPLKAKLSAKSSSAPEPKSNKRERMTPKKRRHAKSWGPYIAKVLKQSHPLLGITPRAINALDVFVHDMFDRLAAQASKMYRESQRLTLSSREVKTALHMVLPTLLAQHAEASVVQAVERWIASAPRYQSRHSFSERDTD